MKHYFNICLETLEDPRSGQTCFINTHKFQLKTTMFGEDINTSWMPLGVFINKFKLTDGLNNILIDNPLLIESAFENNVKIDFTAEKAGIGRFYTLDDYKDYTLSSLDGKTINEMDSNIEEG